MDLRLLAQKRLSAGTVHRLKGPIRKVLQWWYRDDLSRLAWLYHTDKWGSHFYTPHYDRYFRPIKSRRLNVLEIGVGGYENSGAGGASLRMWKAYFRKSHIVGIDIFDKRHMSEHRIDVRQCDQTDAEALHRLSQEYGGFNIIIDDGSHMNEHVIRSFEVLFPLLRADGIYVIEDTQTAYWPSMGGGINAPKSSMAYFKNLVDGLNYMEFPIAKYQPNYFEENIVEISFVHNMIFIRKGRNDEKTNLPEQVEREIASLQTCNAS
ncbi:MAG TPA: class I SAM-dependent methyltransferase [Acidobacteriaceae bacterium]|nr:class I SAM-dependent methyltransferase [Acidobacteriaceae bacterium]